MKQILSVLAIVAFAGNALAQAETDDIDARSLLKLNLSDW